MGFKRRILLIMMLIACLVAGSAGVALAKPPIKIDLGIGGTVTSDGGIELSWKNIPGANFYLVYRAPVYNGVKSGRFKHIGTAYGNSYIDYNVGKNRTYRYFLRFGVGKKHYKSVKKDVHLGINPPRFLTSVDGGDEYSSTDYDRITLVAVPGDGTRPDGIILEKKKGKAFEKIDTKEYGEDAAKEGYRLEFVDKDVNAGETCQYRIRAFKGKGKQGTKSRYTYIRMTALNQVGRYRLSWAPNTLKQDNTLVLRVDSQKYNYGLILDKKNTCKVKLADAKTGTDTEGAARVSHVSADGKTWKKAPGNYTIKGGTTYLAITGEDVGANTVSELTISGKYSGKDASITMKNQLKLFYLYNDANVEFYGNKNE